MKDLSSERRLWQSLKALIESDGRKYLDACGVDVVGAHAFQMTRHAWYPCNSCIQSPSFLNNLRYASEL